MNNGTAFSIEVRGVQLGMSLALTFGEQDLEWFEDNSQTDGFVTTALSLTLDPNNLGVFGDSNAELRVVDKPHWATTLGQAVRWATQDARDNYVLGDSRTTRAAGIVLLTAEQIRDMARSAGYTKQHVVLSS